MVLNTPLAASQTVDAARGGCIALRAGAKSLQRTFLEIPDQISGKVHRSPESASVCSLALDIPRSADVTHDQSPVFHAINAELLRRGVDFETFTKAISTLDSAQDDEPSRGALVETIFHPVPSVDNRLQTQQSGSPLAWHAARMTLFPSWSCMGLLARAVHCNVGRSELWAMLPTD
jgi:hypothetical protein